MRHLLQSWTTGLARSSKLTAGVTAIALMTACGGDSATGPSSGSSSAVGSYTLSSVNGKTVPTSLFAEGTYSFDITGGTLKLTTDGKFVAVFNGRQTLPGSVSNFVDSAAGSWTQAGSSLQMTFEDGSTTPATSEKNTLSGTFTYNGVSLAAVYGNKK